MSHTAKCPVRTRKDTARGKSHARSLRAIVSVVALLTLNVQGSPARAESKQALEFIQTVRSGDTTAVKALLAKDPKLIRRAAGFPEWTALQSACANHDAPMVRVLLRSSPDLEARDRDGARALHLAVKGRQDTASDVMAARHEVQEALLAAGASVASTDSWGATPLHWAAMYADAGFARLLLAHGANVHAKTPKEGMTPLHAAADGGSVEIVRLFLEQGADARARDRGGRTPYDVARMTSHADAAELLAPPGSAR